jgi:hypothetical protein
MERWDKCKKAGYRVCPPDVKLVTEIPEGKRSSYFGSSMLEQAKKVCENCQHYEENKIWNLS